MSHPAPPGWSTLIAPSPPHPPPHLVLFKHPNVGLYNGDVDLRHLGEAQLYLTETTIFLFFTDAKPDPSKNGSNNNNKVGNLEFIGSPSSQADSKNLFLELQLSSVESHKWTGGFAMFSSPKIHLVLKKLSFQPKLSFRNGGIEEFVKHLEICLKKKSWLKIEDPSNAKTNIAVGTGAATAGPSPNVIAPATASGANNQSGGSNHPLSSSTTANNNNNNNNNNGLLAEGASTATRAGLAGILARQNERKAQLHETIKLSTGGEVDDLIVKSKELQSLMDRFRQELAKGDYKLCPDQIDHLKKLDARFAIVGVAGTSGSTGGSDPPSSSNSNNTNNNNNKHVPSTTPKEIASEMARFIQTDSVISSTVRVPLVELFAAFNVSRGFSFELSPSEFQDALQSLLKNYPERRILNLSIAKNAGLNPSFALKKDHLVQFHVLATQLVVLEQVLGPKPFFSQSFRKIDADFVGRVVKSYRSINILQCSKLLKVPVDEARELLMQLEIGEGVLMRDDHPSVGMRFSWNLFANLS